MTTPNSALSTRAIDRPAWFRENIGLAATSHFVDVKGTSIHYRRWGGARGKRPGLVFVHGGYAHSHWWDFIAPEFLDAHSVIALDCSGCGESDYKDEYAVGDTAAEITAVCEDADFDGNAFLIAHSLGFHFALQATLQACGRYRGMIGIDPPRAGGDEGNAEVALRAERVFASQAEAVERFQIQGLRHNAFIADYIAERSVKQTQEGWTWKVDPNWVQRMSTRGGIAPTSSRLSDDMGCPLSILLGAESAHSSAARLEACRKAVGAASVITIDDAGHHVHLDQPRAVVLEIKRILASWRSDTIDG